MGKDYRNCSRTSRTPRRPYEKERIDREMQLVGKYGLKNKREVWRVTYTLAKMRAVARTLLTLPPKDPKRVFEGDAIVRRLARLGILGEGEQKLDYILGLTPEKFLDRRLQSRVHGTGLAKSVHHARTLIRQRHIRVGKSMVNVPSFMVRADSEKLIGYSATSPYGNGRAGRVARKTARGGNKKEEAAEEEEE